MSAGFNYNIPVFIIYLISTFTAILCYTEWL